MLLRQVELKLLLKTRAITVLVEGLVLGPFLGELLGETVLRRNGPGPSGLLVLRAGRRRGGNLTPCECLVDTVELWEDEFAVAVVLGACGLRLQVLASVGSIAAACRTPALVVLLQADQCNNSAVGGPRACGLAGGEGGVSRVAGSWRLLPCSQTC